MTLYNLLPHGGDKLGVCNRLQQLHRQLCFLKSSLVSDEQIQTRHNKRDQFDTIAGYPILIQMSNGLKS